VNSTLFLAAQPSALEGIARVLDMGGTLTVYNDSLSGEFADLVATTADWAAVGDAIRERAQQFAALHEVQPTE
jgi:hypothetical protein